MHRVVIMGILLMVGCAPTATRQPLPTANIHLQTATWAAVIPTITLLPTITPTTMPLPTPTPDSAEAQYRLWMEEAHAAHPYAESIEQMWAVMMCESGGQPEISSGLYVGLFQYSSSTWAGEWNPYREAPITDPRSQIFATAKAWQDGHQSWWGCYR